MKKPCYINSFASIHPSGFTGEDRMLHAIEPDYKEIITNANMRRRMSHIIKMGVACGLMCLEQNKDKNIDAIITATGLGCLADTEKFLNNLVENDEQLLNPSTFIQSTFNTIGAQIALLTGNHSYNNTYVHRGLSFESALIDGMMKVWEGNKQILIGAVDEVISTEYTILKRLGMLNNINIGEGAHFFTLSSEKDIQTSVELMSVRTFTGKLRFEKILQNTIDFLKDNKLETSQIHHLITGRNGNKIKDNIYNDIEKLFPSASTSTFKDICGEYPTASAFGMWRGVNLLKEADNVEYLLIYNHYYNINHSLILLRKC
ncbi:beta-ketoacyl synthase chain length factor [Dysgonomonas sp. Marseille-P4677]|uniref:beta-ketoacyl synthase chain length factor n=1 Tax=Dysgonomonas sp. Marseille-P4677 TaxID=2364790 RepID=UPI001914A184|nr:beta-ketoacyl synthase chain length factor [Dysgonomonas sp. Marseille-P4677]MBK5720099.1 beta-ketoacyl synthase chain length factor [Dysgonomonas sp. Marseille-P4677]